MQIHCQQTLTICRWLGSEFIMSKWNFSKLGSCLTNFATHWFLHYLGEEEAEEISMNDFMFTAFLESTNSCFLK